jgi:hypothetical protein
MIYLRILTCWFIHRRSTRDKRPTYKKKSAEDDDEAKKKGKVTQGSKKVKKNKKE